MRRIIKLIPIIWGFFIFDCYGQKIGKTSVSLNDYIIIEISDIRMVGVIELVQITDLNDKEIYNLKSNYDDNEYFMTDDGIIYQKRTIQLKKLKQKGGKFKFNVKVISKTGRILYTREFNPSFERLQKVIKINFI